MKETIFFYVAMGLRGDGGWMSIGMDGKKDYQERIRVRGQMQKRNRMLDGVR